jgi:hypothetical protein
MEKGKLVYRLPSIKEIQDRAKKEVASLPSVFRTLTTTQKPPVALSTELKKLTNSVRNNQA